MEQLPKQSDMSRVLTLLIDILFFMIIAASFVFYGNYLFRPSASPVIFVGMLTVYFIIIMSWIDYHSYINEYPYKDTKLARTRFSVHLVLVAMCAYLLYSLGTSQATPDLSPYLWGFPIILALYLASRIIIQREYEIVGDERETLELEAIEQAAAKEEAIEQDLLLTYLCGAIAICLVYQFIALPAILSAHGGLNWLFIVLPPLASIAYKYQRQKQG